MSPADFKQLHQDCQRFQAASILWPLVLTRLISQCDGFIEYMSLDEDTTSGWLTARTSILLNRLPADADDPALAQALAAEFEGFYCHAVACGHAPVRWSSRAEPFKAFIERHPETDAYIGSHPHNTDTEAVALALMYVAGGQ